MFSLSVLPTALEYIVTTWLQERGVKQASIKNIDLNLFDGTMVIEGLEAGDGMNIQHLSLDIEGWSLWKHIVHVRALSMSGSSLHVLEKNGVWQVHGIDQILLDSGIEASKVPDDRASPWLVIVDKLALESADLALKSSQFELTLPIKSMQFSLSGLTGKQQHIVNRLEFGPTRFSGFGYQLHSAGLTFTGHFSLSLLANDLVASIQGRKLAIELDDLRLENAQGMALVSMDTLKSQDMQLDGAGEIRASALHMLGLHIEPGLSGNKRLMLKQLDMTGLNADMGGHIAVGKLVLKHLNVEGVTAGDTQSSKNITGLASVAGITLADIAMNGRESCEVKSIAIDTVHLESALTGNGALQLKRLELQQLALHQLESQLKRTIQISEIALMQLRINGFGGGDDAAQIASAELSGIAMHEDKVLGLKHLALHHVEVKRQHGKQVLGVIETVKLDQFNMTSADTGTFESLLMEQVRMPSDATEALGTIAAIRANGARLDKGGFYRLKQLQFDGLQANIMKHQDGSIAVLDMLREQAQKQAISKHKDRAKSKAASRSESKTEAEAESKSTSKAKKTVVRIGALGISPGSRINVRDESVLPGLNTSLRIKRFKFAPVDSSGEQSGRLDMQLQLGKAALLDASGTLVPVAGKKFATDLKLELKDFDLSQLSGYLEAIFGKAIKTGQLNLDSEIQIANNRIDATNHILLRKLALDDSRQEDKAEQELTTPVGMPVGMALDMLRDHSGNISLDVPLKGALDDPGVSLQSIINKALMSSLGTGAMTYAALVLQPYGSIIIAADLAGGLVIDAVKPKLTPVLYAERSYALSADMKNYLTKIKALLSSKDFSLQICGIATRIEGEAIMQPMDQKAAVAPMESPALSDAQLLELAQSRSDSLRKVLLAQGIAASRLFNCRAAIDESALQADPRVELLLD